MAKKSAGRPEIPEEVRRSVLMQTRVSESDSKKVKGMAESAGISVSEWLRMRATAPQMRSNIAIDNVPAELQGVFLKVERACDHISNLKEEIALFFKRTDTYAFVTEVDHSTGEELLYCKLAVPMPNIWNIVVGEALYNLVSALDHLYIALTVKHKGAANGGQFPIQKNFKSFEEKRKTMENSIGPAATKIMTETIKPFRPENGHNGINLILWLLKEARNHDGHNFLVPCAVDAGLIFRLDSLGIIFDTPAGGRLDTGVQISRKSMNINSATEISFKEAIDTQPQLSVSGDIVFDKFRNLDELEGFPVILALEEFVSVTKTTINHFAHLFR